MRLENRLWMKKAGNGKVETGLILEDDIKQLLKEEIAWKNGCRPVGASHGNIYIGLQYADPAKKPEWAAVSL